MRDFHFIASKQNKKAMSEFDRALLLAKKMDELTTKMQDLRSEYFARIQKAEGKDTRKMGRGYSAQEKLKALDHFDVTIVDSLRALKNFDGVTPDKVAKPLNDGRLGECKKLADEINELVKGISEKENVTTQLTFTRSEIARSPKDTNGAVRSDEAIKNRGRLFGYFMNQLRSRMEELEQEYKDRSKKKPNQFKLFGHNAENKLTAFEKIKGMCRKLNGGTSLAPQLRTENEKESDFHLCERYKAALPSPAKGVNGARLGKCADLLPLADKELYAACAFEGYIPEKKTDGSHEYVMPAHAHLVVQPSAKPACTI